MCHTVDGSEIREKPVDKEFISLSHYLQGFIHVRWCRISSINSMFCCFFVFSPKKVYREVFLFVKLYNTCGDKP